MNKSCFNIPFGRAGRKTFCENLLLYLQNINKQEVAILEIALEEGMFYKTDKTADAPVQNLVAAQEFSEEIHNFDNFVIKLCKWLLAEAIKRSIMSLFRSCNFFRILIIR